jgi:poly(3-hydroxybutyrate) depolymerase
MLTLHALRHASTNRAGKTSGWFGQKDERAGTGLDKKGAAAGFVVVAPQGVRGNDGEEAKDEAAGAEAIAKAAAASALDAAADLLPGRRWSNASDEGDRANAVEAAEANSAEQPLPNDVAFLWAIGACIRDTLHVPLSGAVHAAGWSQGGKVASALACASPDDAALRKGLTLAAVAVGAGVSPARCEQSARIPLLMLQGGEDKLVPFCEDGLPYKAGAKALTTWAASCGCAPLNASAAWQARCGGRELRVYTPPRCERADAVPLALYWLPKLAHKVPSGNLPGLAGDFGDLFVRFFKSVTAGAPDVAPFAGLAPCGNNVKEPCGRPACGARARAALVGSA